MLETGLFFLLSWSAFLSAEAAGLTGQCFVWAAHRMCEYLCFPPLTKPPSLTLQEVKWIVSESASPRRKKKKKCIHYMTAQSEVSKVPIPLLSLLVRKETLKSTNDRCTDGWFYTQDSLLRV